MTKHLFNACLYHKHLNINLSKYRVLFHILDIMNYWTCIILDIKLNSNGKQCT